MVTKSTFLRNHLAVTGSLRDAMNLGFLKIYAGPVPVNADAVPAGETLLATISNNSTATGLSFENSATNGILEKTIAEIWSGAVTNPTVLTATFYRFEDAATNVLIQGTVGSAGADLNLTDVTPPDGSTQNIDIYRLAFPT